MRPQPDERTPGLPCSGTCRLTLHWTLLERLELSSYPYHWAGLTGSIPLALYLYKHK